jgi:hypothetical protein
MNQIPLPRAFLGFIFLGSPGLYSTMSGCKCAFLLLEYSQNDISISPTLFVTKVPLQVPHDCGTALIIAGTSLEAPIFKKRRSTQDPNCLSFDNQPFAGALIVLSRAISAWFSLFKI